MRNLFANQWKDAPSRCAILGPACRQVNAQGSQEGGLRTAVILQ
jgi:hypothetical protein